MADVVFRTSGTTGVAKEIVRTEASLEADARNLVSTFPEVWGTDSAFFRERPHVVASVSSEHLYGALWRTRAPALAGFPVEPETIVSVEQLVSLATGENRYPLIFVTTPSFLEKAMAHPDFALLKGTFHAIVSSGSPLRREAALSVAQTLGICPLEIYGSTEAGSVAWRRQTEGECCTLIPHVRADVDGSGRLVVDSPFAIACPFVMGDLAEMTDARHFILKGRADRRVKILENYVSLTEVESALLSHPYVSRVRVDVLEGGVPRLGALIEPSAEGLAVFARGGSSSVATELRMFLRERLAEVAVPRRYRLVRTIPANEQGKTTVAAVRAALSAWCREPAVIRWQTTSERLDADLAFPPDMECFKGHFPGFAVLPGVAQLYFLRHFALEVFPTWPEIATYRKLKFQKVVLPGQIVKMSVVRKDQDTFSFSIDGTNGPCSSGIVERVQK